MMEDSALRRISLKRCSIISAAARKLAWLALTTRRSTCRKSGWRCSAGLIISKGWWRAARPTSHRFAVRSGHDQGEIATTDMEDRPLKRGWGECDESCASETEPA